MGELFEANQDKALAMAGRYMSAAKIPKVDFPAYQNAALIGLWRAEKSFDAARVPSFWTYAAYRVAGHLRDAARELNNRRSSLKHKMITFTDLESSTNNDDGELGNFFERQFLDCAESRVAPDPAEQFIVKEECANLLKRYPSRVRKILKLYYLENRSMKEIGKRFRLTVGRISIIIDQVKRKEQNAAAN